MKKYRIGDLKGALAYKANQLYQAEKQIKQMLPECLQTAASPRLNSLLAEYNQLSGDKTLKLERVFNYLMEEPVQGKNRVVEQMNEETHRLLELTGPGPLRDAVLISCLRTAINYKMTGYEMGRIFALELEMEVVADLLAEVLEWEKTTDDRLQRLAVEEVNVRAMQSGQ